MLRTRVITVVLLLPLLALLVHLGGLIWTAVVGITGILAWRELAQLLQRDHYSVDFALGLFFVIGAIAEAHVRATGLAPVDLLRPLLAALIIFSLIWALYLRSEQPTADWGVTVAGALYLGFLLGHFVGLRLLPDGLRWLWATFILTWVADAMAFFVGRTFGRHKMWPRISPKKTWEGLAGGVLFTLATGPILAVYFLHINPWLGLLFAALVCAAAVFGDLAVSLFKRMARLKDTSSLIPGHGGLLDRLDSLLFTVPVAFYFATIVAPR